MKRKIIGILLLIVVTVSVVWMLLRSYSTVQNPNWKTIPENAALIIEINDPTEVLSTLRQGNEIWESLIAQEGFVDFNNGLFLIDSLLNGAEVSMKSQAYVDKEEFHHFEQGIKELLRNFLEFFLSYGLELSKLPQDKTFEALSQKLRTLSKSGNDAKKL